MRTAVHPVVKVDKPPSTRGPHWMPRCGSDSPRSGTSTLMMAPRCFISPGPSWRGLATLGGRFDQSATRVAAPRQRHAIPTHVHAGKNCQALPRSHWLPTETPRLSSLSFVIVIVRIFTTYYLTYMQSLMLSRRTARLRRVNAFPYPPVSPASILLS